MLETRAYCAHCRKVVAVTVILLSLGRDQARCQKCGRTWPVGASRV